MISDEVRNNYEYIKTWQGNVHIKEDIIYQGSAAETRFRTAIDSTAEEPNSIMARREWMIEFSIDTVSDSLYAGYKPTAGLQYIDLDRQMSLKPRGTLADRRAIRTPEYELHSNVNRLREGVVVSRSAYKQKKNPDSFTPPVFDPRDPLVHGNPIWETFDKAIEQIKSKGYVGIDGHVMKVEEISNSDSVQYRVQLPAKISSTDYLFLTMVFSGNVGLNMTLLETTNVKGVMLQKATWEYELKEGVYLPTKKTKQRYDVEGNLIYFQEIVYENLQINKPVSPSTFTHQNLDLRNGDRYIDKIENKEYVFKNGQMVLDVKKQQ